MHTLVLENGRLKCPVRKEECYARKEGDCRRREQASSKTADQAALVSPRCTCTGTKHTNKTVRRTGTDNRPETR